MGQDFCEVPIRFDSTASDEAKQQLLLTMQSLVDVLSVFDTDRKLVTEDWSGPYRTQFDGEHGAVMRTGGLLVEALQRLAIRVEGESFEARAAIHAQDERFEQQRREFEAARR